MALKSQDLTLIARGFREDSHWRDALGLSWDMMTVSGRNAIAKSLCELAQKAIARHFCVDPERLPPRLIHCAGCDVVEAIVKFETETGHGTGLVRIRIDDGDRSTPMAWTLLTALDQIRGHVETTIRETREEPACLHNVYGPNWLEKRATTRAFVDHNSAFW